MLTSQQAQLIYGSPNPTGAGYLVTFKTPFPFYPSWQPLTAVNAITCHCAIADALKGALTEILSYYGLAKIKELGIDRYGGCFNYRQMTAGKNLSLHSWGLAIDLDPKRNLYHETSKTARFARPEYKKMIDIFYKWGFESLGRERNIDWMHFQISSKFLPNLAKKK